MIISNDQFQKEVYSSKYYINEVKFPSYAFPNKLLSKKWFFISYYSIRNFNFNATFFYLLIALIFFPKFFTIIFDHVGLLNKNIAISIFAIEIGLGIAFAIFLIFFYQKKFFTSLIFSYFVYKYVFDLIVFLNVIFNNLIPLSQQSLRFYLFLALIIVCLIISPEIQRMFLLFFLTTNNVRNIYIKHFNKKDYPWLKIKIEQKEKNVNKYKFLISLLIIVIVTIGFIAVGYIGNFISRLFQAPFQNNKNIITTISNQRDLHQLIVYYLTIVIIAPLIEEFVFRASIINFGNAKILAPIVSGFIFAYAHIHTLTDFSSIFTYLFSGLFISFVYWWFGNYWFCFFGHFFNNLIALLFILFPNFLSF